MMATSYNTDHSSIMDTPIGVVLEIIVVLGILFVFFVLPAILNSRAAPSGSTYDSSTELKAQDEKAKQYVEDYEREQQAKEAQEEYEDYLEWVREGRP